jgi:hypothetical protein
VDCIFPVLSLNQPPNSQADTVQCCAVNTPGNNVLCLHVLLCRAVAAYTVLYVDIYSSKLQEARVTIQYCTILQTSYAR